MRLLREFRNQSIARMRIELSLLLTRDGDKSIDLDDKWLQTTDLTVRANLIMPEDGMPNLQSVCDYINARTVEVTHG